MELTIRSSLKDTSSAGSRLLAIINLRVGPKKSIAEQGVQVKRLEIVDLYFKKM
jgi:hypothetical protein